MQLNYTELCKDTTAALCNTAHIGRTTGAYSPGLMCEEVEANRRPMNKKEAVARTLEDVSELLNTLLEFLESDSAHLEDSRVREEVAKFPWQARERAITEMMVAAEGLRNRIRYIEAKV